MIKIMEDGLCCDKGHDNILAVRAVIMNLVYSYTIDELPLTFTVVHEETDKLIETHFFELGHITEVEED